MPELRTIFAHEAAEVPAYDVGAKVMRAARRRRRLRTTVATAAVLAAVLGGGGLFVTLKSTSPAGNMVAADRPATASSVSWLPSSVDTTVPEPPPLPLDRAVGRGALIYKTCSPPCPERLVTADGTQYALPRVAQMPPTIPRRATLSPDGRWLSYADAQGNYLLRDLTGTKTLPTGNRRATGWSADSAWVGVADASSEDGVEVIAPPATTAAARPLPAHDTRPLAGVTSDGAAVFGGTEAHEDGNPRIDLYIVDDSGNGRSVPVDVKGHVGSKEDLHSGTLIRTVDDGTVLVQLLEWSDDNNGRTSIPGDLLHIDAASGAVLARIRLPEPVNTTTVNGDSATTAKGEAFRTLAAVVPDGVLLKVIRDGAPVAVELLDLASGDRSTIATFKSSAATEVLLPGES